jgi:hypothetical protein
MFLAAFMALVVVWALGVLGHIGGGLINLLLLVALVVLAFDFFYRRQV